MLIHWKGCSQDKIEYKVDLFLPATLLTKKEKKWSHLVHRASLHNNPPPHILVKLTKIFINFNLQYLPAIHWNSLNKIHSEYKPQSSTIGIVANNINRLFISGKAIYCTVISTHTQTRVYLFEFVFFSITCTDCEHPISLRTQLFAVRKVLVYLRQRTEYYSK